MQIFPSKKNSYLGKNLHYSSIFASATPGIGCHLALILQLKFQVFTLYYIMWEWMCRGMAVEDATSESGVKLNFEDYPYAQDGLDLWCAFKSWVTDYVNIYYADDKIVQQDIELQQWWSEIRTKGHGDKKDAPGWPSLTSKASLVETLTTILWIPSAHHAAVNFGQYAYTGYMPNQPAVMRRPVPEVNSKEHSQLLASPEKFFLQSHGKPSQATIVMTVVEILSKHAQEEEYIGQRLVEGWTNNNEVLSSSSSPLSINKGCVALWPCHLH